jgi:subtilase family serine protease
VRIRASLAEDRHLNIRGQRISLKHRYLRAAMRFAALLALCVTVLCVSAAPAAELFKGVTPRARIAGAVNDDVRSTLAGNRHPFATDVNDDGPADDAVRLERMILLLKPDAEQAAALENFLAAAHDRASPQYGKWLDAPTFEQHFGAAAADVQRIAQWLAGHGFVIDEIPAGRRAIIFSGTAAQVRATFRTEMRQYRINGERHLANAEDPQIPAAFAAVVDGVVSLHDFHSRPLHNRAQVAPGYTAGGTHYLAAADFHTIYNLKPLYAKGIDGSGISIAILGRTNVNIADMQQFRATMGLAANPPQIIVNGADPGLVSGDHGESDLDLEWSGAVAPAATIKFVTSASTGTSDGIALSAQYAISNNVADIISLSYGECESVMGATQRNFYNTLWQQAAALGITVVVSSGDSGAAGCDLASQSSATHARGVNGLCSPQYSTCVGGTQFADTANPALYWSPATNPADQSSAISYIPEVVWNESGGGGGLWASGGGSSIAWTKPTWQTTPGVPANNKRYVPDVALTAAVHDGYLVYSSDNATNTQTQYVFGGTSASAPSFAGIMALVNQKTGYRQGNANPTLYGLATRQVSSGNPAYFHLITSGNNTVPGLTGFSASVANSHFNEATGLGSVDANVLVNRWIDLLPASSTLLIATPNPIISGQSVTFTATVTGAAPTGTVQFADGMSIVGSAVTLSGGVATLTTGALTAGVHSITATYSGNIGNQPSTSAAVQQAVIAVSSVNVSSSAALIAAGGAVAFTATVSGLAPGGTVQFQDGGISLGAPVALSASTAVLNTNALITAGSHNITAVYAGDAANTASTSPAFVEAVVPATSSISLVTSASLLGAGQSVTFTATVNGAAPTGFVQFTDGGINLGAAVALVGGTAALTSTALAAGNHAIAATYSGDANNLGSASAALTQIITAGSGGNPAVPTMPEWAVLLLGLLLISIIRQRFARQLQAASLRRALKPGSGRAA